MSADPTLVAGQSAITFSGNGASILSSTLPAPATAKNLIVWVAAGDKDIGDLDGPEGFAKPVDLRSSQVSLVIAWKEAVGGETEISATITGANISGSEVWVGEYEQDGTGAWELKATPGLNGSDGTTSTLTLSSGTTGVTSGGGLAIAGFAVDSVSTGGSAPEGTASYTNGYVERVNPTTVAGNASPWVAEKVVGAGVTTETTITRNGGAVADQMSGGVIVLGRVPDAPPPGDEEPPPVTTTQASARRNLCPNPAMRNNTAGWFGPSGWSRSTSVDASLPRTTGFAGTSSGRIISPRVQVIPGARYVASCSVHAIDAQDTIYGIDWYAGGAYHSSSPARPLVLAADATDTFSVGPIIAPAGADQALFVIDNVDAAQVTALLFERAMVAGGAYFDGDTPGANWEGTAGNSISNLLTATDPFRFGDGASLVSTIPGPVGGDGAQLSETASVVGSGVADDEVHWAELALIVASGYDDRYGRIRLQVHGFPRATVRVVVFSRPENTHTWSEVRGGRVAVVDGAMARTVDDYEFTAGVLMHYKIVAYASPEEAADVITATATLTRTAPLGEVWLKFIAAPWLNRKVKLIGHSEISRASQNATYRVKGRRSPVVVTDVHASREFSISCETFSLAETESLDEALRSGYPLFFHTPATIVPPTIYAAVGDYQWAPPTTRSVRARFNIALTEVTAPPPSVVGAVATYQLLLDLHTSYADVLEQADNYGELL